MANPSAESSSPASKGTSWGIIRIVGYGLLVMSLLEYLAILLPPRLLDPEWEFSALGQIVERVPVPLLALALIFLGDTQLRQKWERPLLGVLSWFSLGLSIFLFLMIPFWGVMNTVRLNTQNIQEIDGQLTAQSDQFTQFEQQLNQASPEDITTFLESQGVTLEDSAGDPKDQILGQLQQIRERSQEQADIEKVSRRNTLFESSIKWNASALISGILFVYIWRLSRWARVSGKKRSKATSKVLEKS
jgi:hypothetical protein